MFWGKSKEEKQKEEQKKIEETEKLIDIAVRFLSNPKIEDTSESAKKSFLRKKGLSEENIKLAFEKHKENKEKQEKKNTPEKEVKSSELPLLQEQVVQETFDEKCEVAKKTNFLSLRNNQIQQIPNQVFQVENLQNLILSVNKITIIQDEIKNLNKLRVFHAVNCTLYDHTFQNGFWNLQNLEDINLSNNNISDMSKFVGFLKLKQLNLSENQIIEIPQQIDQLQNLEILNLKLNNISVIPLNLIKLKKLSRFTITQNNIDKEVLEIQQKEGLEGLYNYLQKQ